MVFARGRTPIGADGSSRSSILRIAEADREGRPCAEAWPRCRSMEPTSLYRDDLAYIHDRGFTAFAHEAAHALLQIFKESGVRSGLVVDLGCGSSFDLGRKDEKTR